MYFDANSFTVGGQTVTVDETAYCLSIDWSGTTDTPEFAVDNNLIPYGGVTLVAGMTVSGAADIIFKAGSIAILVL